MSSKIKVISTIFLSAAMLCGGLSACAKKEEVVQTSKLVIWTTESHPGASAVMHSIEQQFEKEHPGVDVVIEAINWDKLSERLINATTSDSLPDVTHIQPFMAYSLYEQNKLLPLTDVRDAIEAENGPIFPAVRDLQVYGPDKQAYGIAYAVGTTFWSTRTDMLRGVSAGNLATWDDYIRFARMAKEKDPKHNFVTLPGGSPFFIDQLFAELVANAGGKLFNDRRCPQLESAEVVDTLRFFQRLNTEGLLSPDWATQQYLDQFLQLADGKVVNVPVTYARASRSVQASFDKQTPTKIADEKLLLWLNQPTRTAGGKSIATIDAEPWVLLSVSRNRKQSDGRTNEELGKAFLHLYYKRENYLAFTKTVPIHLTPIFEPLANDPVYVAATAPFQSWHQNTLQRLKDGSTRPILMPDLSEEGRTIPYLLDFQRAGILSGAVADVIQSNQAPEAAAKRAQTRALQLVQRSGVKTCT